MTCSQTNIREFFKGDSYDRTLLFTDFSNAVIDLTGSQIHHYIKNSRSDALAIKDTTMTLTELLGKAEMSVLMDMNIGDYYEYFVWTKSDGKKKTFGEGQITIK